MPKCSRCGKRGLFIKLSNGLCNSCAKSEEQEPPISPSDKEYYRPDSYYTDTVPTLSVDFAGNYGRRKVITFEERKSISYPSRSGLYVAEILLLQYCSHGTYPHPKNGYPGFWWFEYGIRNVDAKLDSLRERDFIEYCTAAEVLPSLTIPKLKGIADSLSISVSGKKADIVSQIIAVAPTKTLESFITDRKYKLTRKGEAELQENGYVPYMHKSSNKTIEGAPFGYEFNVWTINALIGSGDKRCWKEVVADEEAKLHGYTERHVAESQKRSKEITDSYKESNPELYRELKALDDHRDLQEYQFSKIKEAEQKFKENGNIDELIKFWESIWNSDGLAFNGSHWTFRLPDIYIAQKRYDDAIRILFKIKNPIYQDKVKGYIDKVYNLKRKATKP